MGSVPTTSASRQPAQPTGFDEVAVAGAHRIAIDAFRFDTCTGRKCRCLGAPASLNRVVQTADDRPRRHKRLDQQPQQRVAQRPTRPGRAVEHAMIGLKLAFVTQAHDTCTCRRCKCPQHSRDSAPARDQDRAHQQNLRVLPNSVGKVRRKDLNQAKIVRGQGRPRLLLAENAADPALSVSATG